MYNLYIYMNYLCVYNSQERDRKGEYVCIYIYISNTHILVNSYLCMMIMYIYHYFCVKPTSENHLTS